MTTQLLPALPAHRRLLDGLMRPYLAELSACTGMEQPPRSYPYLDCYWRHPDRFPYLILWQGRPAGFMLVRGDRDPATGEPLKEIAELFVVSALRRQSIASTAVGRVFEADPGEWRVCVLKRNLGAYRFWHGLIAGVDPGFTERAADGWYVFSFETPDGATRPRFS